MFLKTIIAVNPEHDPKDLHSLLDALDSKVDISEDLVVLPGMVADSLAHASPWENIHDKLLIDATSPVEGDPRSLREPLKGCPDSLEISASGVEGVVQARMLRSSILVVTTNIEGGPSPNENVEDNDEEGAKKQREKIRTIMESIWSLEGASNLRWLFITDADVDLSEGDWKRVLLWQFFCRFDVGRDLHFDSQKGRVCWDATAPIPSQDGPIPVRRWPGVTLHDPDVLSRVDSWLEEGGF